MGKTSSSIKLESDPEQRLPHICIRTEEECERLNNALMYSQKETE